MTMTKHFSIQSKINNHDNMFIAMYHNSYIKPQLNNYQARVWKAIMVPLNGLSRVKAMMQRNTIVHDIVFFCKIYKFKS